MEMMDSAKGVCPCVSLNINLNNTATKLWKFANLELHWWIQAPNVARDERSIHHHPNLTAILWLQSKLRLWYTCTHRLHLNL
eukprot:166867-Pelagomonas_calceolata.AAC.1